MIKVSNKEIYVGNKDGMKNCGADFAIVNLLRNVKGYRCHQSIVGWRGRGCPRNHPDYYFKECSNELFVNMADEIAMEYIYEEQVDKCMAFIDEKLAEGKKVYICCSQGMSRSPFITALYLQKIGEINSLDEFSKLYPHKMYPSFKMYFDRRNINN